MNNHTTGAITDAAKGINRHATVVTKNAVTDINTHANQAAEDINAGVVKAAKGIEGHVTAAAKTAVIDINANTTSALTGATNELKVHTTSTVAGATTKNIAHANTLAAIVLHNFDDLKNHLGHGFNTLDKTAKQIGEIISQLGTQTSNQHNTLVQQLDVAVNKFTQEFEHMRTFNRYNFDGVSCQQEHLRKCVSDMHGDLNNKFVQLGQNLNTHIEKLHDISLKNHDAINSSLKTIEQKLQHSHTQLGNLVQEIAVKITAHIDEQMAKAVTGVNAHTAEQSTKIVSEMFEHIKWLKTSLSYEVDAQLYHKLGSLSETMKSGLAQAGHLSATHKADVLKELIQLETRLGQLNTLHKDDVLKAMAQHNNDLKHLSQQVLKNSTFCKRAFCAYGLGTAAVIGGYKYYTSYQQKAAEAARKAADDAKIKEAADAKRKEKENSYFNIVKAHTWNRPIGGFTDGGKYVTSAVAVAALGYGAYKLAPIVKNAIVGKLASEEKTPVVIKHCPVQKRTMRRPA